MKYIREAFKDSMDVEVIEGAAHHVPLDSPLELVLSKLSELTIGVNELRACQANAVTRQDLQEYYERSNAETRCPVADGAKF